MLRAQASSPREGWTCSRLYLEQVRDLAKLLSLSQAEPRSRTRDQSTEPMAREPRLSSCQKDHRGCTEPGRGRGIALLLQLRLVQLLTATLCLLLMEGLQKRC